MLNKLFLLNKLTKKIKSEFECYKEAILELSKVDIFNKANEIYVIYEVYYFLAENNDVEFEFSEEQIASLAQEDNILIGIFYYYEQKEGSSVVNWEHTQRLIANFIEDECE